MGHKEEFEYWTAPWTLGLRRRYCDADVCCGSGGWPMHSDWTSLQNLSSTEEDVSLLPVGNIWGGERMFPF